MTTTAKLFMYGRSQAVRLPKEFRFEGKEVRISRVGNDFLPDGIPDDPPVEPDPRKFIDE